MDVRTENKCNLEATEIVGVSASASRQNEDIINGSFWISWGSCLALNAVTLTETSPAKRNVYDCARCNISTGFSCYLRPAPRLVKRSVHFCVSSRTPINRSFIFGISSPRSSSLFRSRREAFRRCHSLIMETVKHGLNFEDREFRDFGLYKK